MTAMNRFDQLNSERRELALLEDSEWGFDFAYSFKEGHEREHCSFDNAPNPKS